jgi:hypothetical protein
MARARRQPPLFEVLHEPSRRGGSGGSALSPGTGLRPVQVTPSVRRPEAEEPVVEAPVPETPSREAETEGASPAAWRWGGDWSLNSQTGILMAIAAVMVLVALTWVIAFQQGEGNAAAKLKLGGSEEPVAPAITDPMLEADGRGAISPRPTSQRPVSTNTTSTTSRRPVETASGPVVAWEPGTDPREPAHNYLLIATVPYRDAEAMAQFLSEQGVPAAAAPASDKVDPKRAMANNDPHVVFPLKGVHSSEYSARQGERDALKARVEQIGKLWRKAGGYEDFSKAQWARYK